METDIKISFDSGQIADFCRRHHISKMSLYGSVIRDDFTPDSDVDVLVEFQPTRVLGEFFDMIAELEEILGRPVDLVQPDHLNRYYKAEVIREAVPIYVAS